MSIYMYILAASDRKSATWGGNNARKYVLTAHAVAHGEQALLAAPARRPCSPSLLADPAHRPCSPTLLTVPSPPSCPTAGRR